MLPSVDDIKLAQRLWDFMFIKDEPVQSDVIIGLGGHDMNVVDDVAELYELGMAPRVLFTGNVGRTTHGLFDASEAQVMKDRAIERGIDESVMLIEELSTNTGDNLRFSQYLLEQQGIQPQSVLLVHTPYMLMRDRAVFYKQWIGAGNVRLQCWASPIKLEDYLVQARSAVDEISIITGDLQRLKTYYELGFQAEQPIPDDVWQVYEALIDRGYDSHLVR